MRQISDCGGACGYAWTDPDDGEPIDVPTGALVPPPAAWAAVATVAEIFVPGHPRTKGSLAVRHVVGKARLSDSELSRDWLEHMAEHVRRTWDPRPAVTGPVIVSAWLRYRRPTRGAAAADSWPTGGQFGDLDKLMRAVLDALQIGGMIVNDRQVVEIGRSSKTWARPGEPPGVTIRIEEIVDDA